MQSSLAIADLPWLEAHSTRRWVRLGRVAAYWAVTVPVAQEMVAGAIWDLRRIEYVRAIIAHLGYPDYLPLIIGVGKIPCALALLSKGFPRLKEWAYAGAFFNYGGAAASHFAVGDRRQGWLVPLFLAAFTLLSRALLPEARTKLPQGWRRRRGSLVWSFPVLVTGVMLVVSLVTLPRGAPPQ